MRHLKSGRKLNRTSSHKRALMRNLATALITHKRIATTEAKAKELRPYIEKIITRAKKALVREQENKLPQGQTIDIHARRMVASDIFGKGAVQELFDEIAPKVSERPGGYCRIIKTGVRRGDAARTAIIQLVDWYDVQDGAISTKRKKKTAAKKPKPVVKAAAPVAEVATTPAIEETPILEDNKLVVDATDNIIEEMPVVEDVVAEEVEAAPADEPIAEVIPAEEAPAEEEKPAE